MVDDELATFAADPEFAGMFITDALDHLGTIESTILKLEASPGDLTLITDLCETMKYGSLCALGGFTPYPVMSAIKHWPEDFA